MQSVVLHGLEAFADITLSTEATGGTWTVPPFFIDSVCHLAGFVMNVSDAIDTRANFCVTPGWGSLRLARPLAAGGRYRSYLRMIPDTADATVYHGDVYVLQQDGGEGEIVGVMQAIKFRRYPRVLLNRFFSAAEVANPDSAGDVSDGKGAHENPSVKPPAAAVKESAQGSGQTKSAQPGTKPSQQPLPAPAPKPNATFTATAASSKEEATPPVEKAAPSAPNTATSSAASKAMALVATETALDASELKDDATFAELGVDSLMSLVIAEKLREQLGIAVSGSLFLEYPTVGDLRAWLLEYHS